MYVTHGYSVAARVYSHSCISKVGTLVCAVDKVKFADKVPITLTARSKTWVGGCSLDGTADVNPLKT